MKMLVENAKMLPTLPSSSSDEDFENGLDEDEVDRTNDVDNTDSVFLSLKLTHTLTHMHDYSDFS